MRRKIIALSLLVSIAASASPPTFLMGRYTQKLPAMKKAAALALRNSDCKSVDSGLYIPPGEQLHPGKAYLIECIAPSRAGGIMDLYFSEADIEAGRTTHTPHPVSINAAGNACRNALLHRYSDSDKLKVRLVRISDNRTANRRVDAVVQGDGLTAHAYCIVTPDARAETHLLLQ